MQPEKQREVGVARGRVGSVLGGKFRLLQLLGVGGMAAVYEAQHRNGKRVALKVMHRSLDGSARERERFLREAYAANTIGHDGVVQIFDDGVDASGAVYLVMELLEGATLADLQRSAGGKLELSLAIAAGDQLLDVLAVAHERGVIHRDIKPANLFMTKNGQLKVLDFGVARVFQAIEGSTIETQSGAMLGTPAFMPQEQARGRWAEVEARSDLWAVGATLFTLVSGEHVHHGETPNEQLGRAMTIPPRSLASVVPDLPSPFTEVVDRALRYELQERWPDARAMRNALRQAWRMVESGEPASSIDPWAIEMATRQSASGFGVATLSAAANSADLAPPVERTHDPASNVSSLRWASLAAIAFVGTALFFALKLSARDHRSPPALAAPSSSPAPSRPTSQPTETSTAPVSVPVPAPAPAPAPATAPTLLSSDPPPRPARKRPTRRPENESVVGSASPAEPAPPATDPLDIRY